jgi:hypothetical protein
MLGCFHPAEHEPVPPALIEGQPVTIFEVSHERFHVPEKGL